MFKKMNVSSPLGIALSVAAIVIALSPEARKTARKLMVKGTASVMDTMEQVGAVTAGIVKRQTEMAKNHDVQEQDNDNRSVRDDVQAASEERHASDVLSQPFEEGRENTDSHHAENPEAEKPRVNFAETTSSGEGMSSTPLQTGMSSPPLKPL